MTFQTCFLEFGLDTFLTRSFREGSDGVIGDEVTVSEITLASESEETEL